MPGNHVNISQDDLSSLAKNRQIKRFLMSIFWSQFGSKLYGVLISATEMHVKFQIDSNVWSVTSMIYYIVAFMMYPSVPFLLSPSMNK